MSNDNLPVSDLSPTPAKPSLVAQVKKWGAIIWHVPGVENAVLSIVAKLVVRIGLSAGAGALVVGVIEAVAANL